MAAVKQKKQHTTCLKTSVKQTKKKKKTSCDRGLYFRYRHARVVNKHNASRHGLFSEVE